jgi:hypothetical protein
MSTWKNEDDIKAELRVLTDELRRLREELRGMVAPPKPNPTRAFLHRQSWPGSRETRDVRGEVRDEPDIAAETPRPKRRKRRVGR